MADFVQGAGFVQGYGIYPGSPADRARLLEFMQRTYAELGTSNPQGTQHLQQTLDHHLSADTPLWWVVPAIDHPIDPAKAGAKAIAGLWLGTAIDQRSGDRHGYLMLLYVMPAHRRRGIGLALMEQAHHWCQMRGDRQMSLQVFEDNPAALALYQKLGYQTTARLMQTVWS